MGPRMGPRSRITGTYRDWPGFAGTHRDSPGFTRTQQDSPELTGTHRDSPETHRDSPGLAGTHRWSCRLEAQGETGRVSTEPRTDAKLYGTFRSGHGSRGRRLRTSGMGKCAGFMSERRVSWHRSTVVSRSRAVGSQVRNDRRPRCPPLLLNGVPSKWHRLR